MMAFRDFYACVQREVFIASLKYTPPVKCFREYGSVLKGSIMQFHSLLRHVKPRDCISGQKGFLV
jgi:hypothetical protein